MTTYKSGPRHESQPVVDHTSDPLVPATVIARHIDSTPATVILRARSGTFPSYRNGRRWLFSLAEVLEAMRPSDDPWAQSPQSARARRKR